MRGDERGTRNQEESAPVPGGRRPAAWLARLGRGAAHRPWTVLALAALAVLAALAASTRLKVETDLLAVVSGEDPAIQAFLETTERFGSLDRLMVVLHLPTDGADGAPGAAREPYLELADRVAAGLAELPEVERVDYRVPELTALTRELMPYAVLLVPPQRLDDLERKLSPEGLAESAAATRHRLTSPEGTLYRGRLRADPFDLLPLLEDRFRPTASSELVDPASGYFISPDGRLLLLDVRATSPAHDVPFARRLVERTREVLEERVAAVRSELPEASRDAFSPRPALAGGYALAAADVDRVQTDLARNTAFALVAVGTLFLLAFRRLAAFWLALVPLAVGLVLTAGMAALTVGRLSSITSSVTALLVGLGVDFTIVLLERYGEERRRGRSRRVASAVMLGHTGRGVVIGALTTAATFFAFLVCDFRGLFELGWLTGGGILLCLASTLLLLPALLALADRDDHVVALRMRSFGSPWLVRLARRRPALTVALWAVALLGVGLGLRHLDFDDELQSLRSADHAVLSTQREVSDAFGLAPSRMILRLDAESPEELLAEAHRVRRELQPLLDDGTLMSVLSLADLVPPREEQRAVLERLRTAPGGTFDPERVAADARRALREAGLAPAAFEAAVTGLAGALHPPGPIDVAALEDTSLGVYLDSLLARSPGGWSTALYLVPPPDSWQSRPPPRVEALAAEEGRVLVGLNTVSEAMRRQTWRDLDWAAPIALLAVWMLLVLDFRNLGRGTLAFLPVVPGLVVMLGLAGWLGIPLSLMNLFVVVLVLGIGVDYGVHMVHRYREARITGEDMERGLGETSKAVLLASLTTALGFGSLALSGFAGLRSVGWLSVFGALGSGLAALTLLPALLAWRQLRREREGRG